MNGKYLGWSLLFAWTVAILAGLWLYNSKQIVSFDPNQVLAQAATSMSFDGNLVALLSAQGVEPGTLVHLQTDASCYCNTLTSQHRDALLNELGEQGYQAKTLNIATVPGLAALLPAFPAIAIIDEQRQLRYLGPYATGYGCFTGQTLIDNIVSIARAEYHGAVIQADAKGCFCQTRAG
ncbi:DUF6436 domain-containing protein [Alteromonas antoniana]|uniref:DUF6436 domain-containing protein n=1 Tax=Alteromonas antoniana TaxID=2803813 RepID=UPI001C47A33E|nr:DUF6436 domain-containing protein [Alteromonas antoniana]